ncbi:hypothetical protein pdam_00010160 [Pocillopora damicornis]|uniref:Olfactomedin-like domain-containing protein n=1 Tax=Pocillopora damicornis TaxID=46731 RepID=A0A3M6UP69_POCDA|nr:hypothetical protein pdam_00010160 [Pocillopora damicornis]
MFEVFSLKKEPMYSLGNAFVVCEVIFRIDNFRKNPITINFAYYTKTEKQWNPNIHFVNQYDYSYKVD